MINNSDVKVSYQGNGSTKVFPFTFPFIDKSYIKVAIYDSLTETTTILTQDYYVDANAKTVTYPGYAPGQEPAQADQPPILPSTSTITIYRSTEISQLVDLGENYPLPDIESMSDKLTEILQEHKESLDRSIKVQIGDPETPEEKWLDMQTYVAETAASAAAASASATAAYNSQTAAANSQTAAYNSQTAAAASQTAAANSQSAAANSAYAASNSASSAANSAAQASASQTAAANSASAAANSAGSAASSAAQAASSQQAADAQAGYVLAAKEAAQTAAQTAESAMATTASNAAEAARIVATLDAYDVPAWDEDTVYSYPDVVAYTDGQSYRCIGENVPAGTAPLHSTVWVPLTVRGGDDYFEIDMMGNIQSREYPTVSATFELDTDGNIMPRATDDESVAIANTAAETYASQAATSATNAANSATAAGNSQTAAANSASAANNSAIAAAASAATATAAVELDADGNVTSTDNGL